MSSTAGTKRENFPAHVTRVRLASVDTYVFEDVDRTVHRLVPAVAAKVYLAPGVLRVGASSPEPKVGAVGIPLHRLEQARIDRDNDEEEITLSPLILCIGSPSESGSE